MRFIEKMYSLADFPEGEVINVDGLRVEFSDGWGLVRAVNDASALSLRFEAVSQDVMRRIQVQFKSLMLQVKPDISLPF
jgi:phosphomannomutase/phosphoglucomutase